MKLITGKDFKDWDQYTIKHEPIASIELMERASQAFADEFYGYCVFEKCRVEVVCGQGNNGGDGLAIARILRSLFVDVEVHILEFMDKPTLDFSANLERLKKLGDIQISYYKDTMPDFHRKSIIIDAILGTGVNKPITGMLADWIRHLNLQPNKVVSVDMPSGMPTEGICTGVSIRSTKVITFQRPKLSFFLRDNYELCPYWKVVDIGLSRSFIKNLDTSTYLINRKLVAQINMTRKRHSHKGDYGHALIIAGSEGKIGAAILATTACLRAGAGLVTASVPECGREIIHETIPEAMVMSKGFTCFNGIVKDIGAYTIGIGPGLGTHDKTARSMEALLKSAVKPMVVDADGLNLLAKRQDLFDYLPKGSVLTPHYKEFQRLFGEVASESEMIDKAVEISKTRGWILVLKGAYTRIITPEGLQYINITGNPGMATAGSGDVLTGIITGLMAQGLKTSDAAMLGVYIHGLAADLAIRDQSYESLIAGDIVKCLGKAFKRIHRSNRWI